MTTSQHDDLLAELQGIEGATWLSPAMKALASDTNDRVRALADREMEVGLSAGDFTSLLVEAAERAKANANSRP